MVRLLTLTVALLLTHRVEAHGYLSQPAATFANGINTTYNTIITESIDPAFQGKKWNDNPEANTAMFTSTFPNSQFDTLRAMIDTAAPDCGNTILTGTRIDVRGLGSMKWQNDQGKAGFIDSHHGPCEAWIDDTRVFQSDDCRADYTGYPAEIPIDFSVCSGDCTFTFYWLAMHEANWQVYRLTGCYARSVVTDDVSCVLTNSHSSVNVMERSCADSDAGIDLNLLYW